MEIEDLDLVEDHKIKRAADNYEMGVGEELKIKVGNDFVLDTEVPVGKQWEINIIVHIVETDE